MMTNMYNGFSRSLTVIFENLRSLTERFTALALTIVLLRWKVVLVGDSCKMGAGGENVLGLFCKDENFF